MRNPARRCARVILGENPADDLSLFLNDLQLAGLALDGAVSVWASADVATFVQDCFHPAPNLPFHILLVKLPDQAAQANCNRVRTPFVSGPDVDAVERESLVDVGEVLHVSRTAV